MKKRNSDLMEMAIQSPKISIAPTDFGYVWIRRFHIRIPASRREVRQRFTEKPSGAIFNF
ncbi:MAG: hypothetical protein SFV22_20620 [Saprospiraceae bacterium]|nr:hypothetical protein [Saprospiraceae bacterium]